MSESDDQLSPTVLYILWVLNMELYLSALVMRVPQLHSIYTSKSTVGLSLIAIILDLMSLSIMAFYQTAMSYDLWTYGYTMAALPQDFVFIGMVLYYRGQLKIAQHSLFFLIYLSCCFVIGNNLLSEIVMQALIALTTPFLIWSKIIQLYEIVSLGDAGTVSLLTWLQITFDTAIQLLTAALKTKDVYMVINYASSEIFNALIVVAIVYYRFFHRGEHRD